MGVARQFASHTLQGRFQGQQHQAALFRVHAETGGSRRTSPRVVDELQTARDALAKSRIAVLNRRHIARHALVKRQLRYRLTQIDNQIKAIDAAIRKLVKADEALARKAAVLTSIPGVAAITAAGLLAAMPELGRLDAKADSSLAGLVPVARESGQWKGRRFIGGGRGRVRKLLYMAALSAVQHNPDLAGVYSRLRERAKPGKVALTAVMREPIMLANTLPKEDREWTPAFSTSPWPRAGLPYPALD